MKTEVRELKDALLSSGWRDRDDLSVEAIDCLVEQSYAAIGLVYTDDGGELIRRWGPAQAELADLRTQLGRDRDLYLLICVPYIDSESMKEIPEIVGDTHTCRKIVVEVGGRTAVEALSDVPVLYWNSNLDDIENTLPSATDGLTERVMKDLGTKGASRILDALIDGSYD